MYVMGASSPVRVSGFVEYAQAEQYFRLLLETAPDAMVVIKHDGKIVLVNSQTERLFGYHREELLGNTVSLRNSVERAPTAIGVVRSISELRGDAKQLGNESGLRDCILFRHPSYSAFPNHMQCFDSLQGPPSG